MAFNWLAVAACLLPNVGAWINAIRYRSSIEGWYQTLKKPSWTPPDCVFMPVWTCLYTGMGYASYLVWRDAGMTLKGAATLPLTLYATQLALNWTWSEICFGRHNLKWSFYEMVLLDFAVAASIWRFYDVNHVAGLLMIPYLGWLAFATALAHRIYIDNPLLDARKK